MANKYSILLCEGDSNILSVLKESLQKAGYQVESVTTGEDYREQMKQTKCDLLLIDADMLNESGTELVAELRGMMINKPILFLSENTETSNIVAAYEAGCDEYILKPFSLEVLIWKINAIIRRAYPQQETLETEFHLGKMKFDGLNRVLDGRSLSTRENEVLLMLCRGANQLGDRGLILRNVWNEDSAFTSRSLSVYIHHLRQLLSAKSKVKILSVHGKGYKLIIEK